MEQYPYLNVVVAKILREKRMALGLSKRKLASLAMIEPAYLRGLENGKWNLSLNVLMHLCEALEIEPERFMKEVRQELEKEHGKKWPFLC